METKPPRKEKLTKLWIIMCLLESKEKRLSITDLRNRARDELGIDKGRKSPKALYPHFDKLKKEQLIVCGNGSGYSLPENWESVKYIISLDRYFKISQMKDRERRIITTELIKLFPETSQLMANVYFGTTSQKNFIKKKNGYLESSRRRKEIETVNYCDGLFLGILNIKQFNTQNDTMSVISDDLEKIGTLDELKDYAGKLKQTSKSPPDILFELLNIDVKNARKLWLDKATPKKYALICQYFLKLIDDEMNRMGFELTEEKK